MEDLIRKFSELGGSFVSDAREIQSRLSRCKAFVFDWDGVFNRGEKVVGSGSPFSEVDSMGTNLLRFSHYLKTGSLPFSAVISGEKNDSAISFSQRECFHFSFFKTPHKIEALQHICSSQHFSPEETAFFFDDVLDLSIAERCGLRILIRHRSNPMFEDYCRKNKLVDYITASDGDHYAVRESCELLMALNGNYDEVIRHRSTYSETYGTYLGLRRAVKTEALSIKEGKIESLSLY